MLADETDKAYKAISPKADWAFYIQADEVLHEKYLEVVKNEMILSLNDESAIFTNNGKNLFVFDGSTISNTSISDRFIQGGTVSLNFFNFVMIKLFDTKIVNKKTESNNSVLFLRKMRDSNPRANFSA